MNVDVYFVGQLLAIALAALAALFDHKRGEIPSWLPLGAMGIALLLYGATGGLMAAGLCVGGAALAALAPFSLMRIGAMGRGDVEALAAFGALLGPGPGLEAELFCFLLAIASQALRLRRKGHLKETLRRAGGLLLRRPKNDEERPFEEVRLGPAMLAGVILAVAGIHV